MTALSLNSQDLLKQARKFHTKKELGQHFLVNAEALNTICAALSLKKEDPVLEIGPGIGFLTRLLCEQSEQVSSVELDRESVNYLKSLKLPNLQIKHGDFLSYEIESGRFRQAGTKGWQENPEALSRIRNLKIVGNVPYQIIGLILGHLLGEIGTPASHLPSVERIVLTIQKEVGERMLAKPGSKTYAQLSLLINYFCQAEKILDLPAADFFPAPKVDSVVVRLTPFQEIPVQCANQKFLRRVIKSGFAQRRKMLRNALSSLGIKQEDLDKVFKSLNFDPQVRAESLSLQQFATLSDSLAQYIRT